MSDTVFSSAFAQDIEGMEKWRETMGYTGSCYRYEMRKFDKYCAGHFPHSDTLTWEIAISYLDMLREHRDVRVDVAAIRSLGKYQRMRGKAACIFPADYFSYKRRCEPHIMTDEECSRFFKAADNFPVRKNAPLLTYTAAAFFRLQYSTGMRPQETRRLARSDFDFKGGTVYIADSKRHKDRRIAVDWEIMDMCRKYDAIARSFFPESTVFFPNARGKVFDCNGIWKLFKACWKAAGNPVERGYCSPYILRHSFATQTITRWMEEGRDFGQCMPYLSAYMGHQTFRETCYYLHLLPDRLAAQKFMDISDLFAEAPYGQ